MKSNRAQRVTLISYLYGSSMSAQKRYKLDSNELDLFVSRVISADMIAKTSSNFGGATATGATSGNGNLERDQDAALCCAATALSSLKFTDRFLHAHSSNAVNSQLST